VIDDLGQLPAALADAEQSYPRYLDAQRHTSETFDLTDTPLSVRAVRAITTFLGAG
jgi:hypothetical protein